MNGLDHDMYINLILDPSSNVLISTNGITFLIFTPLLYIIYSIYFFHFQVKPFLVEQSFIIRYLNVRKIPTLLLTSSIEIRFTQRDSTIQKNFTTSGGAIIFHNFLLGIFQFIQFFSFNKRPSIRKLQAYISKSKSVCFFFASEGIPICINKK